jgi:signal transduction histidine kinase
MAATTVAISETGTSPRTPSRDPLANYFFSLTLAGVLILVLAFGSETIIQTASRAWPELLFWGLLVFGANLFPIWVGEGPEVTLTLDMPLMVATALLYPPEVAAFIVLVAAIDIRELGLRIPPIRIMFNRVQVALTAWVASQTFHALASALEPWPRAALATLGAVTISYCLNILLVSTYTWLRLSIGPLPVIRSLRVGGRAQFLATYLGYCVLALVLARLFTDVGEWSVISFLVPIAAAQQMLVRGQRLQSLANELRSRERLLERLSERIVDERRDERLRIASDLHDEILQCLTKIGMSAGLVDRALPARSPGRIDLAELIEDTAFSIEELRRVIHDLQRSPLGRGGLGPTLRSLARDLQLDWGVRIRLQAEEDINIAAETQTIIYQIARECLLNALKHSEAREIVVRLSESGERVQLEVADDGTGFDVHSVDASKHFGLGLMKERVRMAGGSLGITSEAGRGTVIVTRFPSEKRRRKESEATPDSGGWSA